MNHFQPDARASRRGSAALVIAALVTATAVLAGRRVGRLEVTGDSMRPVLEPGDRVVVLRGLRPRVGDVVALADPRLPSRTMVKRVAATQGGEYVVLGDNTTAATDSRHFGSIPRSGIRGHVVYRYDPECRRGRLTR